MTAASTNHAKAPARVLLVTGAYFPEISSGGLQCQAVARHLGARGSFSVLTTATDAALASHEAPHHAGQRRESFLRYLCQT